MWPDPQSWSGYFIVPSVPRQEWKAGDRFQGKYSRRTGHIDSITEYTVFFVMDDAPALKEAINRDKFERHAVPIDWAPSAPTAETERVCTICSRTCDVGRCCWWCGAPEVPHV